MANGNDYNGKSIPVTRELLMAWGFRALIFVLTAILIPVALSVLGGISTKFDDVVTSVHSHDTKLELLSQDAQDIKSRISDVKSAVQDHEGRIRALERDGKGNGR